MIRRPLPILLLLTGLNFLNYFDRILLAAVGPSVQRDLGLSDAALGAVASAFLWGYLLTSPVFGHFGDRFPRKILITIGIIVWCLATSASGLAVSFATLWLVRALVGVGEASYASVSPTILDDITPPEKKNRALSLFYAAIPVGSALGFVVGGYLDEKIGWRRAFLFVGTPGLLLALLVLAIVEPPRTQREALQPFWATVKSLGRFRAYVWACLGYVAQTFALGGFAFWAPAYVERTYGLPHSKADQVLGLILVVTGFVGTWLGGILADRLPGKNRLRVSLSVCAASTLLVVPFAFWCVLAPSSNIFFWAIAVAELGIFTSTSPVNGVFLGAVPVVARATAMAVSIFASHLLGDMISVWLVGALSTWSKNLPAAMLVLPTSLLVAAVLWGIGAWAGRDPEEANGLLVKA